MDEAQLAREMTNIKNAYEEMKERTERMRKDIYQEIILLDNAVRALQSRVEALETKQRK